MTKIKLIIFSFSFFLFATVVTAQEKKVEFSIAGGYSGHTSKVKNEANHNLNGFHVGGFFTYNINETLGVQTGILYNTTFGVVVPRDQIFLKKQGTWHQTKTQFNALDIPLKLVYSHMLAEDFYIQLLAGPNFNWALKKQAEREEFIDHKLNTSVKEQNIYELDGYSRLDLQFGAGLGLQWKGIGLSFKYDWGLFNRTTLPNHTYKANDLKITLSYKF